MMRYALNALLRRHAAESENFTVLQFVCLKPQNAAGGKTGVSSVRADYRKGATGWSLCAKSMTGDQPPGLAFNSSGQAG
jgi:hypothetical protein